MKLMPGEPYMIRNDGAVLTCGKVHPYILYKTLSSFDVAISKTILYVPNSFRWFYDNTKQDWVKEEIIHCLQLLSDAFITAYDSGNFDPSKYIGFWFDDLKPILNDFNIIPKVLDTKNHTYNFDVAYRYLKDLNNGCNQEFLRCRTGDKFFGNNAQGDVYFRVSSTDFNWFDIIWKIVNDNKSLSYVTIETDVQAGRTEIPMFYQLNDGTKINRMPREEFLTASGTPLIEWNQSESELILQRGGTIRDAFGNFGPLHNFNKFMQEKYSYTIRFFSTEDGTRLTWEDFKRNQMVDDE